MANVGSIANKRVFALIGGIASGKTTVSNILKELGAYIIEADVISHEITAPGCIGEKEFKKLFPDCIIDGKPDRALIKQKIFSSDKMRNALNDALHPLILAEIHRRIDSASDIIVVVMPIPKELRRYHAVLNVYTPLNIRIDRLIKRDNITVELAEKIISSQMSEQEAELISDFTFINDGNLEKLRRAVKKWWDFYIEN